MICAEPVQPKEILWKAARNPVPKENLRDPKIVQPEVVWFIRENPRKSAAKKILK
jgi:hypothetical protein